MRNEIIKIQDAAANDRNSSILFVAIINVLISLAACINLVICATLLRILTRARLNPRTITEYGRKQKNYITRQQTKCYVISEGTKLLDHDSDEDDASGGGGDIDHTDDDSNISSSADEDD